MTAHSPLNLRQIWIVNLPLTVFVACITNAYNALVLKESFRMAATLATVRSLWPHVIIIIIVLVEVEVKATNDVRYFPYRDFT